jgi:hypothetical protein
VPVSTDLEPRTYFRTLDAAMADLELPLGAVDRARAAVRSIDFEHVFIPDSREYIALEAPGRDAPVAYVTPFYVAHHPAHGDSEFVQIAEPAPAAPAPTSPAPASAPTKAQRLAAQRARASEPVVSACPGCYTHLPATGICDWCG